MLGKAGGDWSSFAAALDVIRLRKEYMSGRGVSSFLLYDGTEADESQPSDDGTPEHANTGQRCDEGRCVSGANRRLFNASSLFIRYLAKARRP